jgi:hypothetical protein
VRDDDGRFLRGGAVVDDDSGWWRWKRWRWWWRVEVGKF